MLAYITRVLPCWADAMPGSDRCTLQGGDGKLLKAFGDGNDARPGDSSGGLPVYRNEELRIRSVFAKGDAVVLSGSEANATRGASSRAQMPAYAFAWDVLSGEVIAAVPAGLGVRAVSCVSWNEKRGQWAGGCSDGESFFDGFSCVCICSLVLLGSVKVYG